MQIPSSFNITDSFLFLRTESYRFLTAYQIDKVKNPATSQLKKNNGFKWDTYYEREFNDLKEVVTKVSVHKFFDIEKPIVLSVDASSTGMGCCLL